MIDQSICVLAMAENPDFAGRSTLYFINSVIIRSVAAILKSWAALANPCALEFGASDRRNTDKEDNTFAILRMIA